MRHSILTELLCSQDGPAPITWVWLVLSIGLAIARESRWARFIWLPTFLVAALFSVSVASLIVVGGYALLGLPVWGLFPVITAILFFRRPPGIAGDRHGFVGLAGLGVVVIALWLVPRPHAMIVRLRFLEGNNDPIRNAAFPLFIYQGIGPNHDGFLRTNPDGLATIELYGFESGSIELRDPSDTRRNTKINFEPAGPLVNHRPTFYRFAGKDEVAVNSAQVLPVFWPGKRDVTKRTTEPLFLFSADAHLTTDSATLVLNVETGKFGEDGDLAFHFACGPDFGNHGPALEIVVRVVAGAAIASTDEQFMDLAPVEGYRSSLEFVRSADDAGYSPNLPFKFYVKTRSGRYAAVGGEIAFWGGSNPDKGALHVGVRYNPGGSRNVEFDHTKWLNRD